MSTTEFKAIPARPCVKCGATERYSTGVCKPCQKAASKSWHGRNIARSNAKDLAWYASNTERANANSAAWDKVNPEKLKAYRQTPAAKASASAAARAWRDENPEKFKAAMAAWRIKNPLKLRIYASNHRAKGLGQDGKLSGGLVAKLFSLQQGTCPCCRQPLGDDFHMDHIVALHNGGPNIDDNIQLLRAECNGSKRIQDPVTFMQGRGFLL
jgi:5-methylcytosine-specific restriction endonuclease McrA